VGNELKGAEKMVLMSDEPAKIYDIADDPLFGIPSCLIFKGELCVTGCEYGIAGDCPRRVAELEAISAIVRAVAELPDRTSPADAPHMMLVSEQELRLILEDLLLGTSA
jgi:hypothetical protein